MKENQKQSIELSEENDYQNEEDNPIVMYIKEKKNLYVKEITRCEDLFIGYKDMITNCNLKGKKYVDAQRILKRLKKYLKEIKAADENVQKSVNDLLDLRAQDEGIMKLQLETNNSCELAQNSNSFDSTDIVDFPQKHTGPKVLRFNNKVSIIYQEHVYQLVYSLLLLHEAISSFMFHQSDIVWVMEGDSKKKKMTTNEFLTKLFPPRLSRYECLDCIKSVLDKRGIKRIPEYSILRQLSSWNVYIDSNGKKGIPPIMLYDFYRNREKKDFEFWVTTRYWPDFIKRHHKTIATEKEMHGKKALEKAAHLKYVDADEIYDSIDADLANQ